MKKSYRLVVFDWEGTLGDTLGHVLNALATHAAQLQLGTLNEHIARQFIILGLPVVIKKVFPHVSLHQQEQLLQQVQDALMLFNPEVCLFPGAKKLVQQMQEAGMNLAIATNKGAHALHRALIATGLEKIFTVTRSAGQTPAKPCPQMLQEIMDEFDVVASETLMIGDSLADIDMASSLGVDAIGVDFYHQNSHLLLSAGALAVCHDYTHLADYLNINGDHVF